MTWVVGGNCFNGFVCVADIQATIFYPKHEGKPNRYFNCVQKIHKITSNLCVAFAGDIRSGLLMVNELRLYIQGYLKDGEYFDIDGQSEIIRTFLKRTYQAINPGATKPALHLLFLWNSQEGDGLVFRPFCMRFKSPEFTMTSAAVPGLLQLGTGSQDPRYKAIAAFLSGQDVQTPEFRKIFNSSNVPGIWTVSKFKNMLFNEGAKVDLPGVSKTFISFESVIPYNELFTEDMHQRLRDAYKLLGIESSVKKTANHEYHEYVLDPEKVISNVESMTVNDTEALIGLSKTLREGYESIDMSPLHSLPSLRSDKIWGEEEVHVGTLLTTWEEMVDFFAMYKIDMQACTAIA